MVDKRFEQLVQCDHLVDDIISWRKEEWVSLLSKKKYFQSESFDLNILNNLQLKKVDLKKFSLVKLLKDLPNNSSLFETVLISLNDYFVFKFLEKKINFKELVTLINKASKLREFQKFKRIKPKNIDDIYRVRDYVSFKMDSFSI